MNVKISLLGAAAALALCLSTQAEAAVTLTAHDLLSTTAIQTGDAHIELVGKFGSGGSKSFGGSSKSFGGGFKSSPSKPSAPSKPYVAPKPTTPAKPATPNTGANKPNFGGATKPNTTLNGGANKPNTGGAFKAQPGKTAGANATRPTAQKPTTARVGAAQSRAKTVIGTNRPRAVGTSTRTVSRGYGTVSVNRYMIGGYPYMGFYSPGYGYIYHNPFFWYWLLSPRERVVYAQQNNISEAQAVQYLQQKGYDVSKVQAGDEAYLQQLSEGEEISTGEDANAGATNGAPSLYEQAVNSGRVYGKFCGGSTGGAYYAYGRHLKDQLPDMVLELGSKAGSVSILTGVDSGECQIGVSQNDVLYGERSTIGVNAMPLVQVLTENAHLLCKDGIGSIQALRRSGGVLAIDKPGSGTNYTWNQMVKLDDSYASILTVPMGGQDALLAMSRSEVSCMLSVVAPGAKSVNDLAKMAKTLGFKLELSSFDDGDFDNAKIVINGTEKRVYTASETDDEQYADLKHVWGDPNTIEMGATVVVNKDWWNGLDELQKQEVLSAVTAAVPHLKAELASRR
ncbi:MAG: hypothetical protein GC134_05880 [Proteobacteria bacterium]|nr:hypothetical protein [Pseudomonadota bacterium]